MDFSFSETSCVVCGNLANLMCQRCGELYCDDVCQRKDWQRHKYICTTMPPLISTRLLRQGMTSRQESVDNLNKTMTKEISKHHSIQTSMMNLTVGKPSDGREVTEVELKEELSMSLNLPIGMLNNHPEISLVRIFERNASCNEPEVALLQVKTLLSINDKLNYCLNEKPGENSKIEFPEDIGNLALAARTEQGYRRALLIDYIKEESLYLVYEVDEGRVSLADEVRRIPSDLLEPPMRVFAVILEKEKSFFKQLFQNSSDLRIMFDMKKLHGADIDKFHSAPASLVSENGETCDVLAHNFLGIVNQVGHNFWREPIENNSLVYISLVLNYQELYISSVQSKEYAELFKLLEKKCQPFENVTDVKTGTHVFVVNERLGNFRGEITDINDDQFFVLNIDTGHSICVQGAWLRKPCRFVANLPVSLRRVKIKNICNIPPSAVDTNSVGFEMLKKLSAEKRNLEVKFEDLDKSIADFIDISVEPQSLMTLLLPLMFSPLEKKLEKAESSKTVAELLVMPPSPPISPKEIEGASQIKRHYFSELENHLPPLGKNVQLLVVNSSEMHKTGYITACYFSCEKDAEELQKLLNLVAELGNAGDETYPEYIPDVGELCLTLFEEDKSWYRGVCLRVAEQKIKICYCDFGNVETVSLDQVKPLPSAVLGGVYATKCYIDGFDKSKDFLALERYFTDKNKILCNVLEGPDPTSRSLNIPMLDKILAGEKV